MLTLTLSNDDMKNFIINDVADEYDDKKGLDDVSFSFSQTPKLIKVSKSEV